MLFDSHTHLTSPRFAADGDLAEVIARIEALDMLVMDVGCDLESSLLAVEHAAKYDWCYASVGYHPHETRDMDENTLSMIKALAKKPKVQAIGEIGLDYHYDHSPRDVQQKWFRRQIRLALALDMPIIIHDREAHEDILRILKEENAFQTKVLMHCFSGSAQMAEQCVKLGCYLSIAGPVTFKNANKLLDVVKVTPMDRLLIETDAPYLTPEPYRGKRNEPSFVQHTAAKVAAIKELSYETVVKSTSDNAKKFFGIY